MSHRFGIHLARISFRCFSTVRSAFLTGVNSFFSLQSSLARFKNQVSRHLAARKLVARRIQRSSSLMRQASAVCRSMASSSASTSSCFSVRSLSAALRVAHLAARGLRTSFASLRRTSSTAFLNSWTTWNQSTVILLVGSREIVN